jgi:hypothetical protein
MVKVKEWIEDKVMRFAFKNHNTFYILPALRISYEWGHYMYLDICWLHLGIEFKLKGKY